MMSDHRETRTGSKNSDPNQGIHSELYEAIIALRTAAVDLVNHQSRLMKKLDLFVTKVMAHEERLKRLEDSLLTYLESATWVKATIRFWPFLVGILLLGQTLCGFFAR